MESSTTSALVALSNDIAGRIERASGAVVGVESGRRFSTSGFYIDDHHIIEPRFDSSKQTAFAEISMWNELLPISDEGMQNEATRNFLAYLRLAD